MALLVNNQVLLHGASIRTEVDGGRKCGRLLFVCLLVAWITDNHTWPAGILAVVFVGCLVLTVVMRLRHACQYGENPLLHTRLTPVCRYGIQASKHHGCAFSELPNWSYYHYSLRAKAQQVLSFQCPKLLIVTSNKTRAGVTTSRMVIATKGAIVIPS